MANVLKYETNSHVKNVFRNITYNLKNNMICGISPTLEFTILVKITVNLWQNTCDEIGKYIRALVLDRNNYSDLLQNMNHFENLVLKKIHIVPHIFKDDLIAMIKLVKFEISKYFISQVHLKFAKWDKLKIYWQSMCWTDEGKIHQLKTASRLIEHPNVNPKEKYIIACNNCLRDEIRNLFTKLPDDFIHEYIRKYRKDAYYGRQNKPYLLILFWTFHTRGEDERFLEMLNEGNIYEHLLKWAIIRGKEVAVHHIWENFADEILKENISSFILFAADKAFSIDGNYCNNILLYFVMQSPNFEPETFSVNIIKCLLWTLDRIARQCPKLLNKETCLMELIRTKTALESLRIITFCWSEKILDLEQYSSIWQKFKFHFKDDTASNFKNIRPQLNFSLLTKKNDIITVMSLLQLSPYRSRRRYIYSKRGMYMCLRLIRDCKIDIFKSFIEELLETPDRILRFKKRLLRYKAEEIREDLFYKQKYESLDAILTECWSRRKITKFKTELPYKRFTIIRLLVNCSINDEDVLTLMNKCLNWCFDENKDKILRCKAKLFDFEKKDTAGRHYHFFHRVSMLIIKRKFELACECWRWIYFATDVKPITIKDKLRRIKLILTKTSLEQSCFLLKRFVTSHFEENEATELRDGLKDSDVLLLAIKYILKSEIAIKYILKSEKYLEADELLSWCYSDDTEEIKNFKVKFMCLFGYELLYDMIRKDEVENEMALFNWFKPSSKSANMFKEIFMDFLNDKNSQRELKKRNKKIQRRAARSMELLADIVEGDIISKEEEEEEERKRKSDQPFNAIKKIKLL